MLNAVIRFALRYRGLIVVLSLALLLYGGYLTASLPIDVFPDLDRPRVVVMTEASGLAPEEVETLVTFPLESALLGATGVEDVRSQSGLGLSVIYVEFGWGTDIKAARQVVQERLVTVQGAMPDDVRPQMAPVSSIMGQIMQIGLSYRAGPRGGELVVVGKTGRVAEMTRDAKTGGIRLFLWEPTERDDLERWKLVRQTDPATLEWGEGEAARKLELKPDADGVISATDLALRGDDSRSPFMDQRRRVTLRIDGSVRAVTFPSLTSRQINLRTVADWDVRPALQKVTGIAQVMVMGGGRKQYQVLADPALLLGHQVTLLELEAALKNNNANSSGGYAVRGGKEKPIRVLGRLGADPEKVIAEIEQIPVKSGPRTVLVGQVARVVEGAQTKRGDAGVNGEAAVILTVTKQPHVDTRDLTERVAEALRQAEASLPPNVVANPNVYQLRGFIDRGIFNVGEALVLGAVLVLIVLFLFLLNFRTTFISLTAIPLSLVITGLVFRLIGKLTGTELSINLMTLGGIAVAMGELVDDAIVDVENIFRRLKENNAAVNPRPVLRVIYEASLEVRSAIVFGTMMVILVFVPLFALSGVEGRLFAPLGVAYIVSILASLVVSLTVTPVLSYYLLPQSKATHAEHDSPLLRAMKRAATPLIRFSMNHASALLVATWALVAVCVVLLMSLGANFLPAFDEGSVQVNVTLPGGASLQDSNDVAAIIDARLRKMRVSPDNLKGEILQFSRRTGRAELDEHAEPVSNTEYLITTNPKSGRSRDDIIAELRSELKADVKGADVEVEQPLAHLISHMLSGVTAQIAIKIHGDDLDELRRLANAVKGEIQGIKGITPPVVEAQQRIEELHIRLRPEQLALYKVDRGYVAEFVSAALKGEEVSQVIEGQRRFDLVVRLDEPYRSDYADLARLRVDLPESGKSVALGELATIGDGLGANQVNRENVRRRIVVRVNAKDRDLASVVADIQAKVGALRQRLQNEGRWPAGYSVEYGGQFESQRRATLLISVMAVGSFVGMFAVLYMLYPSSRIVLQVLNALPTAFIGGVLALVLTRQTLTVAAMVGFISLGGIAARNGILLVTHYFHLMKYEGERFNEAMVVRGSLERLAPVLMTALTAAIALVPLVVGGQQPGREILYPVATVILGGLITSTFCEFLIHPGLFWRFSGKDAVQLVHEGSNADVLESTSPAHS